MGVDWGKSNDFTVLTVMDVTTREMVCMDRFNQIDYAVQRGRLVALADVENPASAAVLGRLGFVEDRVVRAYGRPHRRFVRER